MIILFEGTAYKPDSVINIIDSIYYTVPEKRGNDKVTINCVGYYYNTTLNEPVVILPKVFLSENNKAFGKYYAEDFICYREKNISLPHHIQKELEVLPIIIYQAINLYVKRHPDNGISEEGKIPVIVSNIGTKEVTIFDIVIKLFAFYKENKNILRGIQLRNHSSINKINWRKTINSKAAIIQEESLFYHDLYSKRRIINYDEILIKLFYSVLNSIKLKFNFSVSINSNYDLLKEHELENLYKNGKGTRLLKRIKNKYFTDKLLGLWKILYVYFDKTEKIEAKKYKNEILLIKNFNIVFEDMIDDLLSDVNIHSSLRKHKDNKQLDHIFLYQSLFGKDIYYVGDSKYYATGKYIESKSVYKQYTYAKNVIQHNIDLFNIERLNDNIKYRDNLTEGYNITPNFFITAYIPETYENNKAYLIRTDQSFPLNYHFRNRLFDRDTLILQSYRINFLFVLYSYTGRNQTLKNATGNSARILFRDNLIKDIESRYLFYRIEPFIDIEKFVSQFFCLLAGKIYRASDSDKFIILALEKEEYFREENQQILKEIHLYSFIENLELQ